MQLVLNTSSSFAVASADPSLLPLKFQATRCGAPCHFTSYAGYFESLSFARGAIDNLPSLADISDLTLPFIFFFSFGATCGVATEYFTPMPLVFGTTSPASESVHAA